MLSNAFVAICMLLPTMPSALMLLDLGSLSNLMMTNAAVFLTCSLPKKNPTVFWGEKKSYLSAPPPNAFFFFFYLSCKDSGGRKWERGNFRTGLAIMLASRWRPHCSPTAPVSYTCHSLFPVPLAALLLPPPSSPAISPNPKWYLLASAFILALGQLCVGDQCFR